MNKNNVSFGQGNQQLPLGLRAAKLAVVGEALSTLGDVISTVSAILELEEEQQEQSNKEDYKNMQKQIDYLTIELEKLKNQENKQNPHWE